MKEQLTTILENSRTYTLAVAEAMPEKSYQAKPAEGVWNFGELLNHIAYGIQWWEDNFIKATKTEWNPPAPITGKKEIIAYLVKAFDSVKKTMNSVKLTDKEVYGFHATIDHITHHRGQAVLHLRCNGITPPEYIY